MTVRNEVNLNSLHIPKLPLQYGLDACYITLTDHRYTAETVELRNTPELGKYIHFEKLTPESHEAWLESQLKRGDAINFALIAKSQFSGTVSLYDIRHGVTCEYGRLMMPDDGRRVFAVAAEMLCMSFAFEVLGVQNIYCVVAKGNDSVHNFHLKNGWSIDERYDRYDSVNGQDLHLVGMSIQRADWAQSFAKMSRMVKKLLTLV